MVAPQSRWGFLRRIDWRVDLLGVSIVYLVEGMLDMASLAVSYYCKDNLRLGPADAGLFQTAGQLPWELTPLLGLLTDLVPIGGYRRKAYLVLVGAVGCACWGGLAGLSACPAWLAGCLLLGSAACTAWTQVIADAVLVGMSQGASQDVATFYQCLSWGTYTAGAVVSAYATGRALDAVGPRPVFALAACGLLLDGLCAGLITEERQGAAGFGSGGVSGGSGVSCGDQNGAPGSDKDAGTVPAGEEGHVDAQPGGHGGGDDGQRPWKEQRQQQPQEEEEQQQKEERLLQLDGGLLVGSGAASPAWLERSWGSPLEDDDVAEPLLAQFDGAKTAVCWEGAPGQLQEAAPCPAGQRGVAGLVATVWRTLRDPHILVPALFIFLWQSSPSPSSAMFFFQYNTLHFSAEFQEVVYLAGSLAGVAGVLLYQTCLIRYSLRTMLLWCALLGTCLSATQLLLVTRANLSMGVSDKVFVLGDYAVLKAIAEVMMTPLLALSARVCPPGVEATLYACLYSTLNLSVAVSGALGALLTRACGVTGDGTPRSLALLVALCTGSMLLPLPLLAFIPPVPVTAGDDGVISKGEGGKGADRDRDQGQGSGCCGLLSGRESDPSDDGSGHVGHEQQSGCPGAAQDDVGAAAVSPAVRQGSVGVMAATGAAPGPSGGSGAGPAVPDADGNSPGIKADSSWCVSQALSESESGPAIYAQAKERPACALGRSQSAYAGSVLDCPRPPLQPHVNGGGGGTGCSTCTVMAAHSAAITITIGAGEGSPDRAVGSRPVTPSTSQQDMSAASTPPRRSAFARPPQSPCPSACEPSRHKKVSRLGALGLGLTRSGSTGSVPGARSRGRREGTQPAASGLSPRAAAVVGPYVASPARTHLGSLGGALVGVSPLVRLVRTRSAMRLLGGEVETGAEAEAEAKEEAQSVPDGG